MQKLFLQSDPGHGSAAVYIDREYRAHRGFSLLELMVVVVVALISTAIALPLVKNAVTSFQLKSATSSLTSLIQATRYRAIAAGYEFQLVMTKSTSTYQLQSDTSNSGCPATSCTNITTINGNLAGSGSLWGSSVAATLGQDTTLLFHPSGLVGLVSGAPQVGGVSQITVSYGNVAPETISITNYGYVSVKP